MKQSIGRFLLELFSVLLFLVVAGFAVFFAYGYRIDVGERTVQKTSIIDVAGPRTDAKLFLDGKQQSEVLPYQLKGVLPGTHNVHIRKDGFIKWSREVEVQEDLVSIVRDVLLIPSDLGPFRTEAAVFEEGQRFFSGHDYILAQTPGNSTVRTIVFADNGLIIDDELALYRSGFEVFDAFSDERLLLAFDNDFYALLALDNKDFRLFSLPPTVEEVTLDIDGRIIYFKENGSLYSVSLDEAPQERQFVFDPETFELVYENVEHFVVSRQGDLFLASMGMLYRTDRQKTEFHLLDREPQSIEDIQLFSHDGHEALVVRHHESDMLFVLDSEGTLIEIAPHIWGVPLVNEEVLLYADSERVLHVYDREEGRDRTLRTLEEDEAILGWFDDVGHYLIQQGTNVSIEDIYNSYDVLVLENIEPGTQIFVHDNALFWIDDLQLLRLYWDEALK